MRRTATILAVVALMVVFSTGVVLAAYEVSITGIDDADIISAWVLTSLATELTGTPSTAAAALTT
jgi:hypothetical protein